MEVARVAGAGGRGAGGGGAPPAGGGAGGRAPGAGAGGGPRGATVPRGAPPHGGRGGGAGGGAPRGRRAAGALLAVGACWALGLLGGAAGRGATIAVEVGGFDTAGGATDSSVREQIRMAYAKVLAIDPGRISIVGVKYAGTASYDLLGVQKPPTRDFSTVEKNALERGVRQIVGELSPDSDVGVLVNSAPSSPEEEFGAPSTAMTARVFNLPLLADGRGMLATLEKNVPVLLPGALADSSLTPVLFAEIESVRLQDNATLSATVVTTVQGVPLEDLQRVVDSGRLTKILMGEEEEEAPPLPPPPPKEVPQLLVVGLILGFLVALSGGLVALARRQHSRERRMSNALDTIEQRGTSRGAAALRAGMRTVSLHSSADARRSVIVTDNPLRGLGGGAGAAPGA